MSGNKKTSVRGVSYWISGALRPAYVVVSHSLRSLGCMYQKEWDYYQFNNMPILWSLNLYFSIFFLYSIVNESLLLHSEWAKCEWELAIKILSLHARLSLLFWHSFSQFCLRILFIAPRIDEKFSECEGNFLNCWFSKWLSSLVWFEVRLPSLAFSVINVCTEQCLNSVISLAKNESDSRYKIDKSAFFRCYNFTTAILI